MIDKAIDRLNQEKIDLVLHAGDYIAPFAVRRFKELKARLIGVFGNNDGDQFLLRKQFQALKAAEIRNNFAEILMDGVKIGLLHGEDNELLKSLANANFFDVLIHGHSHQAKVTQKGSTIVLNPGEVCGYLTGKSSIALFDTTSRKTEIVEL
jgi:hypothetical protein